MVQIIYCDRCGKEMQRTKQADFNEFFESFSKDGYVEIDMDGETIGFKKLIRPQLCADCAEIYNRLVDDANNKVKDFLNEGKTAPKIKEKKKSGRFFFSFK